MAQYFNACVEARRCKSNCGHRFKQSNFLVICINLLFSFLSVWNLAYLGCPFDNSKEEELGYSMAHAINVWGSFSYLNHVVMLVVLILQKLVTTGQSY